MILAISSFLMPKIQVILAETADATVTYVNIVDAITARNAHKENYPDSESRTQSLFFS